MQEENMQSGQLPEKFKSVDALVHAYEELESEFTRRSQRLKQLEENAKAASEEVVSPKTQEKQQQQEQPMDGEALFLAVQANEGVRNRVVNEYLSSLKGVPLMMGSGVGVTVPVRKAKTIAEAGDLALGYFRGQQSTK